MILPFGAEIAKCRCINHRKIKPGAWSRTPHKATWNFRIESNPAILQDIHERTQDNRIWLGSNVQKYLIVYYSPSFASFTIRTYERTIHCKECLKSCPSKLNKLRPQRQKTCLNKKTNEILTWTNRSGHHRLNEKTPFLSLGTQLSQFQDKLIKSHQK